MTYDQRTKGPLYAAAGTPEYWILNLAKRRLEVCRSAGSGEARLDRSYGEAALYGPADSVAPLAAARTPVEPAPLFPEA